MAAAAQGKSARNRKILLYAGLAGAALALLVLLRHKNGGGTAGEVTIPAPANTGEGSVGSSIESDRGLFQSELEAALPGAIASGVQTALASQAAQVPTAPSPLETAEIRRDEAETSKTQAETAQLGKQAPSTHAANPKKVNKKRASAHTTHHPGPSGAHHKKPARPAAHPAAHAHAHAAPHTHAKAAPKPHRRQPHHRHK